MPHGVTQKIVERKKAVLNLLADGCKPTSYVIQKLNTTHTEAFYVLQTLAKEGYIRKYSFGKIAIWCLDQNDYNKLIGELISEIRRLVETHKLKYVYPMRLYKLILDDIKTYILISKYAPVGTNRSAVLSFLNYILQIMYGPPSFKGEKTVYITNLTTETPT